MIKPGDKVRLLAFASMPGLAFLREMQSWVGQIATVIDADSDYKPGSITYAVRLEGEEDHWFWPASAVEPVEGEKS